MGVNKIDSRQGQALKIVVQEKLVRGKSRSHKLGDIHQLLQLISDSLYNMTLQVI